MSSLDLTRGRHQIAAAGGLVQARRTGEAIQQAVRGDRQGHDDHLFQWLAPLLPISSPPLSTPLDGGDRSGCRTAGRSPDLSLAKEEDDAPGLPFVCSLRCTLPRRPPHAGLCRGGRPSTGDPLRNDDDVPGLCSPRCTLHRRPREEDDGVLGLPSLCSLRCTHRQQLPCVGLPQRLRRRGCLSCATPGDSFMPDLPPETSCRGCRSCATLRCVLHAGRQRTGAAVRRQPLVHPPPSRPPATPSCRPPSAHSMRNSRRLSCAGLDRRRRRRHRRCYARLRHIVGLHSPRLGDTRRRRRVI